MRSAWRSSGGLGLYVAALQGLRRPLCRACLDWSERRSHLAGALGAALFGHMERDGWLDRMPGSRALRITRKGAERLEAVFGLVEDNEM